MHPNPIYRQTEAAKARAFAKEAGFGILATNGQSGPLLAHVPFTMDGDTVLLHLVRSNPMARAATEPLTATLAVSGPHGYISPDWYGLENQVPTWNYVAVHLKGMLAPLPEDRLGPILDKLSEEFEALLTPKKPWTADKMDPEALDRMKRAILPFEFQITSIDSTYKLSQNKTPAAMEGAALGLSQSTVGQDTQDLARLMRDAIPRIDAT